MHNDSRAFSGFSVNDLDAAKEFYGQTLGLKIEEQPGMGMHLKLADDTSVFVYSKADHVPATFTILNFPVDDIDAAVDDLAAKGVSFEHYGSVDMPQDDKGVLRGRAANMGPDIAWFKDPAGNILSVLQN